jgi:two-component system, NarL family, response regulator DevR
MGRGAPTIAQIVLDNLPEHGEDAAPTRVLVVDEHPVVRVGLATLLAAAGQLVLVGEASSAAQALVEADRTRPDVVIMDVRLPDGDGVATCRELGRRHPGTRVLVLSACADEQVVLAAIAAGAAGYLLKQVEPSQLVHAVRRVAGGGALLDPSLVGTVLQWVQRLGGPAAADPLARAGLSEQERKILPLIADGKTNREIAALLCLTEGTVKGYVSNLLQKLQLTRRTQAAALIARRQSQP